ncbi:hypothetical protein BSZ36_05130 [Rubricoccus marinus]|uniref:Uncharacterized protein n=2 Tax=Rubricoccus marinus TaxID=716817 RepID=A0A259TXB7_9BACT|nr:hypothetical protein BSZ36_05130 [Rubricoccus marinus]
MEMGTRARWDAAWTAFWADVFTGVSDDALDEYLSEAARQETMDPDALAERLADLNAALASIAEGAPCQEETPEETRELDAWAETVGRVTEATRDGGDLALWPHLLPSPPAECPGERAYVSALFADAEPGSAARAALSWPLYLFAFNDAVRRASRVPPEAARAPSRAGVSPPVAQPRHAGEASGA